MTAVRFALPLLLAGLLAACGHASPAVDAHVGAIAAQSQPQTRSVTVQGRKMAFREAGQGPTVVLLHGFPLDHRMWDGQVAALAAHHHVIAPDLAGFGKSDARPGTATMEDDAADVHALLAQLKCPGAVVVGFSMGGYVALAYEHAYQAQVQGLVLLGTDADAADPGSDDTKGLLDLAGQVAAQGPKPAIDAMAPIMLAAENHDTAMAA
ncbi:MAG: alpha/beta hydrolase fold protein, partial [Cyanobacteria bacterium RYN_339]|nr:alpha/beta hydrolase fold protein [Cyanobacteria bacterium RYN_339]